MNEHETIDEAVAAYGRLKGQFDAAMSRCEAELAAGRTGYEAYRQASTLAKPLADLAENIRVRVVQALEDL